nr:hypothetical protein CFP56_35569 [Quercus suber]
MKSIRKRFQFPRGVVTILPHPNEKAYSFAHGEVLGESLCLTTNYLGSEEKVVANSKVNSVEAKSSRSRKDLIEAMDQVMEAKKKVKELKDELKIEKKLVIQKDKEVQATLLKINEERENVITKFLESDCFSDL